MITSFYSLDWTRAQFRKLLESSGFELLNVWTRRNFVPESGALFKAQVWKPKRALPSLCCRSLLHTPNMNGCKSAGNQWLGNFRGGDGEICWRSSGSFPSVLRHRWWYLQDDCHYTCSELLWFQELDHRPLFSFRERVDSLEAGASAVGCRLTLGSALVTAPPTLRTCCYPTFRYSPQTESLIYMVSPPSRIMILQSVLSAPLCFYRSLTWIK